MKRKINNEKYKNEKVPGEGMEGNRNWSYVWDLKSLTEQNLLQKNEIIKLIVKNCLILFVNYYWSLYLVYTRGYFPVFIFSFHNFCLFRFWAFSHEDTIYIIFPLSAMKYNKSKEKKAHFYFESENVKKNSL